MDIVADVLFDTVAAALAASSVGLGSASLAFGLFVNDIMPNTQSALGDFSLATNAGCASTTNDTPGNTVLRDPATGNWILEALPHNHGDFVASSTVGLPVTIYGGVVFIAGSTSVMYSERFIQSTTLSGVGDGINWNPRLTVNRGLLS